MAKFKGTVELIGGLTPKNNGDFPLVEAKDIQVDDIGTRLDQKLQELSTGGGGSGDNSAVVVEILNSDGVITASHSASEIFTLAQAGKVLVACVVSANGELRYQYSRSNVSADGSVIAAIFSTTFVDEQLNDVTTYYVYVDDSKGATITYDELLIGGGSSGGDQTAAEMLEGFERDAGSVKKYVDDNLLGKVDAEEGMGLSSNDFTDAQKRMLDVHEQSISHNIDDILQVRQTADELQLKLNGFETKKGSVKGYIDGCLSDKSDIDHDHDATYLRLTHDVATDAHSDIRLLIQGLDARLTALADSDDTTLDQLSELVAYIKDNRELIESVTTLKVNVTDIINNLTTNAIDKPLSAAQGVALKALIDSLASSKADSASVATAIEEALKSYPTTSAMQSAISTALADYAKTSAIPAKTSQLANDSNFISQSGLSDAVNDALQTAKQSGEFDGTSVTVSSVTESVESGGENVVTFSDGKKLTVKNGKDGKTPAKGTDYWTEADKAAMVSDVLAALPASEEVAV